MQDEDGRIGRNCVQFLDGREELLCELVLGEAADDPHPLRWRRDRDLLLQHRHRVRKRPHAVPAKLHVEVETASDDVQMVVDQARQHPSSFQVDDPCRGTGELHHVVVMADRCEHAVFDGDRARGRIGTVERCKQPTMQDDVWSSGIGHEFFSTILGRGFAAATSATVPSEANTSSFSAPMARET